MATYFVHYSDRKSEEKFSHLVDAIKFAYDLSPELDDLYQAPIHGTDAGNTVEIRSAFGGCVASISWKDD